VVVRLQRVKREPGWKGILSLTENFYGLKELQFNFMYLYYTETVCSGKNWPLAVLFYADFTVFL
jgi:hypothetical protein